MQNMDEAQFCDGKQACQGCHLCDNWGECGNELSARRHTVEHLKKAMELSQQCKVAMAQNTLETGFRYLQELNPDSFSNPTDYEKQLVKRGKDIFLRRTAAPPFLGVVFLEQLISDKDNHFHASFTNVFAAVALKLHIYDIAIEVFQLAVTYFASNASPRAEINKEDLDFLVGVVNTNIGCVYLIMRNLDKAKENLEYALEIFQRLKMKNNNESAEINIVAVRNNLSLVFQGQKNYPAAINIQKYLLEKANNHNLPVQMVAAIHYNRSELFLELKEPIRALKELERLDSLSKITNDEVGILEKFTSSKMCLVYQMTGEIDLAEEIAESLILFSLFPKSSQSPSSTSSTSSSSSSSSSLSSSASSSLSSLSSSSPASSSLSSLFSFSSSNFEDFLKCNEKLAWDFLFTIIENLVDFYLNQENLELVSFLDVLVSECEETFGNDHPTFATLLYRQGVRFFLMEENVSSKNCLEEALSIFASLHLGPTHLEVLKCNVALARLLSCENFQEDQPVTGPNQSACEEPCRETKVFAFSNTSTISSVFRKLVKQIINNEEKIGEFSEVVLKSNLLKLRGPSIGQITAWLHDGRIKMKTQVRHGIRKRNSEANSKEMVPCNCSVVMEVLVKEMKMCASNLGMHLRAFTEESLCICLQPSSIPTMLLPNFVTGNKNKPLPTVSPVTVKREKKATRLESLDLNLVEIGSQQVPLLKPWSIENWEECRCDVKDGVANHSIPLSRDVINEQDHDEKLERGELQTSCREILSSRHFGRPRKSHKKEGIRGNNMPQTSMERPNLTPGGNNPDDRTINEAYGFQEHWNTLPGEISRKGKDAHDNSRRKESVGLKGGHSDECPVSYNSKGAVSADDLESNQFRICSSFLARHSADYNTSLTSDTSLDEDEERPSNILSMYNRFGCFPKKKYHTLQGPSTCCECPDVTDCSTRDHPAYTTKMGSSAQTYSNHSRYHLQQPFLNLVLTPKNGEEKNEKPPLSSSPRYQESGKSLRLTGSDVYTGSVQSRLFPNVSTTADVISQTPTPSSQADTEKETPGIISNEEDEALRLGLLNSNLNTSDEESLAALERRVVEACSLVERTLKEREEKGKTIQERDRRQREERLKKQQEEREKWEREAREAVHWSDGEEAMATMHRSEGRESISTEGEETPAQPAAIPDNPQWLCEHYQRLCRVKFPCCGRFYPCHRCHNNSGCRNENSRAKEAFYIECSVCGHQQEINQEAQACVKCKTKFSAYFCSICKHFTGVDKNPYHCTKCGICRIYKDRSFHCDVCNVCLDKRLQGKHKCNPNSGHDECCICLEDAFSGCQILPCSHKVHRECAIAMIQNGVRSCPICRHPLYSQTGGTE